MRMMFRFTSACLCLTLLASSIQAASGPELIPSSAAGVIKVMAPQKTIKQATQFVNSVQDGMGMLIQSQAGMLGLGISNPTMQGVDQSQDWWAAVFLNKGEDPSLVFFIPATDTEAMGEALDESFTFVAHEKYGIYSDDADAIKLVQDHLSSARPQSMASIASPSIAKSFEGTHVSVAVNLELVKEIYSDELLQFKAEAEEKINEIPNEQLEVPGMNMEFLVEMVDSMKEMAIVAVEDAEAYSFGLTLSDAGLQVYELLEFAEGSQSAQFLNSHPPQPAADLAKLPKEHPVYWSIQGDMSEINKVSMSLLPSMFELSEEETSKWQKVTDEASKLNYKGMAGSFTLGDLQTGLIRTVAIANTSPSAAVREMTKNVTALIDGMEISGMSQKADFKSNAEEIDGIEVDILTTEQDINQDPQFGGIQIMAMQYMYGGNEINTRIAAVDDNHVIQSLGGGKEGMEEAIAAFKGGEAGTDEVMTRDLTPLGKTNLVALFDLPSLVIEGLKIVSEAPNLPPLPFDSESIKQVNVERAYIGVSVGTTKRGCEGQLNVPVETVRSVMSLVQYFQQMQGGGRNAF